MSWLAKYKVSDLALPTPLISLKHPQSTLFEALDLLSEKHILSVPVLAEEGAALLGMLDCLDVVVHTVGTAAEGKTKLADVPLDKVMGLAREGARPAEVGFDTPLDEVAQVISGPARRAVVVDAGGQAHSVITQSALLTFLLSKLDELEGPREQWNAGNLCSPSPVCVTEGQSALSAFRAIHEHSVSSVAIVEEETGHVVSVASATDLVVGLARTPDKAVVPFVTSKAKSLQQLDEISIMDLISGNRQQDQKARAATVSVRSDASLEHILEKFAKTRVHRLIVCDEERKPHGVLSLTDICRAVAEQKS